LINKKTKDISFQFSDKKALVTSEGFYGKYFLNTANTIRMSG